MIFILKNIFAVIYFFISLISFASNIDFSKLEPLTSNTSFTEEPLSKSDTAFFKFVASWCPVCRKELTLEKINSTDKNYVYIFGNYGIDSKEKVLRFLEENPHIEPAYFDENNILRKHFNVNKVPFTVKINE